RREIRETFAEKRARKEKTYFNFPPWKKEIPTRVDISNALKEVYNGELCVFIRAIEHTSSIACINEKFEIFTDNQAGLYRLTTPSGHSGQVYQIRATKAAEAIQAKGAEISLSWVLRYYSGKGNELVDKLVEEATLIQSTSVYLLVFPVFHILICMVIHIDLFENIFVNNIDLKITKDI
ncbi:putative reverse transcriptase protein, partial [Botrytis fragariae]